MSTNTSTPLRPLYCDGTRDCPSPVTHVDEKGYIYCGLHGEQRKINGRGARKLRPFELKRLQRGETISYRARAEKEARMAGACVQCSSKRLGPSRCSDCNHLIGMPRNPAAYPLASATDTCPKCGKVNAGIAGVNETVCASCANEQTLTAECIAAGTDWPPKGEELQRDIQRMLADAFEFTRQGSGSCVVCDAACSVYSVKGYSGIVEACEQHRTQVTSDAIADGAMKEHTLTAKPCPVCTVPTGNTDKDGRCSLCVKEGYPVPTQHLYVLKELQADGTVWTSSEVYDETDRHLRQNVNAGYSGSPRWAERLDGTFVYGVDKRGHLRGTNDICGCRNNAPSSAPNNWHLTTCNLGKKLEAVQEVSHD